MRTLFLMTLIALAAAADLPYVRITIDSGQTFDGWYDAVSYNFFDGRHTTGQESPFGCTYPPDRIVKLKTAKKAPGPMPEYAHRVLEAWRVEQAKNPRKP